MNGRRVRGSDGVVVTWRYEGLARCSPATRAISTFDALSLLMSWISYCEVKQDEAAQRQVSPSLPSSVPLPLARRTLLILRKRGSAIFARQPLLSSVKGVGDVVERQGERTEMRAPPPRAKSVPVDGSLGDARAHASASPSPVRPSAAAALCSSWSSRQDFADAKQLESRSNVPRCVITRRSLQLRLWLWLRLLLMRVVLLLSRPPLRLSLLHSPRISMHPPRKAHAQRLRRIRGR